MNHLMTDENRKIVDSIMKGVAVEDLDVLLEKEKQEKEVTKQFKKYLNSQILIKLKFHVRRQLTCPVRRQLS